MYFEHGLIVFVFFQVPESEVEKATELLSSLQVR